MGAKQAIDRRILSMIRQTARPTISTRSDQVQQAAPVQGYVSTSYGGGREAEIVMSDGSTITAFVGARAVVAGENVVVVGTRSFV